MPNGKGQIDCCYCVHFQGEYEGSDEMYDEGYCKLHKSDIPSTLPNWNHRLCTEIELNKHFEKYIPHNPLEKLFERFEKQLEENVLYEFPYNVPSAITKLKDL